MTKKHSERCFWIGYRLGRAALFLDTAAANPENIIYGIKNLEGVGVLMLRAGYAVEARQVVDIHAYVSRLTKAWRQERKGPKDWHPEGDVEEALAAVVEDIGHLARNFHC